MLLLMLLNKNVVSQKYGSDIDEDLVDNHEHNGINGKGGEGIKHQRGPPASRE